MRVLVVLAVAAAGALLGTACSSSKVASPALGPTDEAAAAEGATLAASGWQVAQLAQTLPHSMPITNIFLSPGGNAAVTLDQQMRVRVWPSLDGQREPIDPGLERVSRVALAHAGKQTIVASLDTVGSVAINAVSLDGSVTEVYRSDQGAPSTDVAVFPGSGTTAILTGDRSIELRGRDGLSLARRDVRGFRPIRLYVAGPALLGAIEAAAGESEVELTLHLFAIETSTSTSGATVRPHGEPHKLAVSESVPNLAISALSPGGARFALATVAANSSVSVTIFDLARGTKVTSELGVMPSPDVRIGFADANRVILVSSNGGGTWSLDAKTGRVSPEPVWTNPANQPRVVGHGRVVSVYGVGLHVYDAKRRAARFITYQTFFPGIGAVSPNGTRYVYQSGVDLYVYDASTDELRTKKWESDSFSLRASFFVDDDTLLLVSQYGSTRLIDVATAAIKASTTGPGGSLSVDYDPIAKRLLVAPRYGESWLYEVSATTVSGPAVISDGHLRAGFLDGEAAIWTVDGQSTLRTYTLEELRAGLSLPVARARGKRISVQPIGVTRDGNVIAAYYKGTPRIGRFDVGPPSAFGSASALREEPSASPSPSAPVAAEPPAPVHTVDLSATFPSVALASNSASVSPDGKRIAMLTPTSVGVYDSETLELQWSQPTPNLVPGVRWATADVLAVSGGSGVAFFDVETGTTRHLSCGPVFVASEGEPPTSFNAASGGICSALADGSSAEPHR